LFEALLALAMFDGAAVVTGVLPLLGAELLSFEGTGALLVPLEAAEVVALDVELLVIGSEDNVVLVAVML